MKATHLHFRLWAATILTLALCSPSLAQTEPDSDDPPVLKSLVTATGPAHVALGDRAMLDVPAGCRFIDAAHAAQFVELTHNLSNGELGIVIPPKGQDIDWWISFNFDESGYVKDNETLDASTVNKILQSLQKNTEAANAQRISRGWDTLNVGGWSQQPFYDPTTHSLTWGVLVNSTRGSSVNYDARVLGRRGVMRVGLVMHQESANATIPTFNKVVTGVAFNAGDTYAEFRPGDKIAQYGLVGLITGGAAVVAFKLWKPLLAFGAVIVGGIGTIFKKIKNAITGRQN